jgi:hypothetical protein
MVVDDRGRVQQGKHKTQRWWNESLLVYDNCKSEGGESQFEELDHCTVKQENEETLEEAKANV